MKTYNIKTVPKIIKTWFETRYPVNNGFTFTFYCYYNFNKTIKYYGCEVRLNNELYSYAAQGTINDFTDVPKPVII